MKEYISGILNSPEDKILIASFLVIRSGSAFHKNLKKISSSSLISSAGGFGNNRNSGAKL